MTKRPDEHRVLVDRGRDEQRAERGSVEPVATEKAGRPAGAHAGGAVRGVDPNDAVADAVELGVHLRAHTIRDHASGAVVFTRWGNGARDPLACTVDGPRRRRRHVWR